MIRCETVTFSCKPFNIAFHTESVLNGKIVRRRMVWFLANISVKTLKKALEPWKVSQLSVSYSGIHNSRLSTVLFTDSAWNNRYVGSFGFKVNAVVENFCSRCIAIDFKDESSFLSNFRMITSTGSLNGSRKVDLEAQVSIVNKLNDRHCKMWVDWEIFDWAFVLARRRMTWNDANQLATMNLSLISRHGCYRRTEELPYS